MDIPLTDIPETSSLQLDLKVDQKELNVILDGLDEYNSSKPESFESQLRLQKMGDTIRLSGEVWVEVFFSCGRCLANRNFDAHGSLEYMLVSQDKYKDKYQDEEIDLTLSDLDVDFYKGEVIDLRPFLREAIILALPHTPSCTIVDEQEACDKVFDKLLPEESPKDKIDPRWAPLMALKDKTTDDNN